MVCIYPFSLVGIHNGEKAVAVNVSAVFSTDDVDDENADEVVIYENVPGTVCVCVPVRLCVAYPNNNGIDNISLSRLVFEANIPRLPVT